MSTDNAAGDPRWADAALVVALLAIDPAGAGGVVVRGCAGPVRDRWIALVRELLPPAAPLRRVPVSIDDSRLLGGLDLAATLRTGEPVAEMGLLASAHGGLVLLAMAERITRATAAHIASVLDAKELRLERDGFALRLPVDIGVIALDEGIAEDERPSAALSDRLAFHLELDGIRAADAQSCWHDAEDIAAARQRLPGVCAGADSMEALCAAAWTLGIGSLRAPLMALRVARAAAALDGRTTLSPEDLAVAGRLVLAPRATQVPMDPAAENGEEYDSADDEVRDEETPPPPESDAEQQQQDEPGQPLEDVVVGAARAAIPAGLLAQLRMAREPSMKARVAGRSGALQRSGLRGRPAGVRRGEARGGARLSILETLRAAAPWQKVRRAEAQAAPGPGPARIAIRPDDFRVTRLKERRPTTAIFVVDASGSSALHRLAEAKGAVELLLADCYVRRDQVAVVAFRGEGAEVLLPPTRSLVRAKRSLAGLPGGGGTPLAAGIDAAAAMANAVLRRGGTPTVVLLTDGRANVGRDGQPGRARAQSEALDAARTLQARGIAALLVDTSPQPQPIAAQLAVAMRAHYLALPYADAAALARSVRSAVTPPAPGPSR